MQFPQFTDDLKHKVMISIDDLRLFILRQFYIQMLQLLSASWNVYMSKFQLDTLVMAEFPSCSYILASLLVAFSMLATVRPDSRSYLLNCWLTPIDESQSSSSASLLIFFITLKVKIYR